MLRGQCNCGAIRFEIAADPPGVIVCHCSLCRRLTGNNGNAVLLVADADFRWISGEERVSNWSMPEHDWQSWFCPVCGSQAPGRNDASTLFVPAGLLTDGGEHLQVIHHLYVDSKAGWDVIGDAGRQHSGAFKP